MPAPLLSHLFPLPRHHREIENHYQTEIAATDVKAIREFLVESSVMQTEAALANLSQLAEIATLQREGNDLLGEIAALQGRGNDFLADIAQSAGEIIELLHGIHSSAAETRAAIERGFGDLAAHMFHQQVTLKEILAALRQPRETTVQELLRKTSTTLTLGAQSSGREERAFYEDALMLVDTALADPIGNTQYLAWFQKGWLVWKLTGDPAAAETPFFNAVRWSRQEANHYHLDALRYLAYMQYLQRQYQDAYTTIQQAVNLSREYVSLWDAARYAAKAGHTTNAIAYLEECLNKNPEAVRMIFAEKDFLAGPILRFVADRLKAERERAAVARAAALPRASAALKNWIAALGILTKAAEEAGCTVKIHESDGKASALEQWKKLDTADYVTLERIASRAASACASLATSAYWDLPSSYSGERRVMAELERLAVSAGYIGDFVYHTFGKIRVGNRTSMPQGQHGAGRREGAESSRKHPGEGKVPFYNEHGDIVGYVEE